MKKVRKFPKEESKSEMPKKVSQKKKKLKPYKKQSKNFKYLLEEEE